MNSHSARQDLAFMKSLVVGDGGAKANEVFGKAYLAAGLLYGAQTFYHWADGAGLITPTSLVNAVVVCGVTASFLAYLGYLVWQHRDAPIGGVSARAVNVVFSITGVANLLLVASIGFLAWREQSLTIWLIYPMVVFILQGTAWLTSFTLMRRPWHAIVALGWFVCSLGIAATLPGSTFVLFIAAGLLLCMALPGFLMMRSARRVAV